MRPGGYESYLDTYIMRDIRDLAQVGDELKFRRFMTACAALTSKPVVYADLARLADISEKTAKTWLVLLASSCVVKIVKPYANNLLKRLSKQPILYFFRNNDKREIDILMERDGTLFPIEVKKTASPSYKDARNLGVLDPVSKSDVPGELASFKRTIGTGCILCMAQDTYPISERAWAFPVWAL